MTITAAQVRKACVLLGWRSPRLARNAGIGFDVASKARKDEGFADLNWLDLRAIREAFERAGVEFGADGTVRRKGVS